jgi:hypothetical protein
MWEEWGHEKARSMLKQADAMRAMAERYLRLAMTTSNPKERTKFLDYASIYAQLSEQSKRKEASTIAVDPQPTKPR